MDDLIEKKQKILSLVKHERMSFFTFYSSKAKYELDVLDLIELENGAQPPKEQHIYEPNEGYVRFVQNRDYGSDSHLTYIPISKRNHICSEKDIMMDKYGEAGEVRYGIAGAYNVALLKIVTKTPSQREYIRDYFSQNNIKNILYLSSQASTRPSLNESTFKALKIPMLTDSDFIEYNQRLTIFLDYELKTKDEINSYQKIKANLLAKYF